MNLTDSFDMGFDIQHYYSLHQNLTLEDLAKASSRHTLKGVVKVINKVSLSPMGVFTFFSDNLRHGDFVLKFPDF